MPRAKPKTGSPVWRAHSHSLTDEAKDKIRSALSLDEAEQGDVAMEDKAFSEVERLLGAYPGLVKAVDEAPRAADYRQQLEPIGRDALKLYMKMCGLNEWLHDALKLNGADTVDGVNLTVEGALMNLHAAIEKTVRQYAGTESRGKPTKGALREVIADLREIFNRYYQGSDNDRLVSGTADNLSERENNEVDFLNAVLSDAKIDFADNVRRYFNTPNPA